MRRRNLLDHPALDRLAERRRDRDWLSRLLAEHDVRVVPVWRSHSLVGGEAPLFLNAEALVDGRQPLLLGTIERAAYVAIDVSDLDDPTTDPALAAGRFVDLRWIAANLAAPDSALLAYARSLVWWHSRHRFCGVCGAATEPRQAGHVRACTNPACATEHFPRTDPAVIVLVHDGDRCLLGRQASWPRGMHSVLAGFVEPGESLEAAVAREVKEEAGIELAEIAYHSSQPWPFPQSLMVGFTAAARTTAITVDGTELEHAAWYDRDWLLSIPPDLKPGEADFCLPSHISISRRLLEDWLGRG